MGPDPRIAVEALGGDPLCRPFGLPRRSHPLIFVDPAARERPGLRFVRREFVGALLRAANREVCDLEQWVAMPRATTP